MRETRYQGAVIRNNHILLLLQLDTQKNELFWTLPGGGKEGKESDEACLVRELKEETGLDIEIITLLFDESDAPSKNYKRRRTYLCFAEGDPIPGYEPGSRRFQIKQAAWFDLCNPKQWPSGFMEDHFVLPVLKRIQKELGYNLEYPREMNFIAPVIFSAD